MKLLFILPLLIVGSLVACATPSATPTPTAAPTATIVSNVFDDAEVKILVLNFGKRLVMVSLQSPLAPQDIKDQYSEFVSPALLQTWINNVTKAPGRVVSSPWPDRIEVTTLTKEASDKYAITGSVVEITSVEMVKGGAAAKIPVRIVVQKIQGQWLITEYSERR